MNELKDKIDIREIRSLKDERIQLAKKLSGLKGRLETGKFLVEGQEAISWALSVGTKIDFILVANTHKELLSTFSQQTTYSISDGLMRKITGRNYVAPVVAIGSTVVVETQQDFCIVLDKVQDFGNIGTIIRTGQAFGINHIISTKKDFDLFQKQTIQASRGSVFKANVETFDGPSATIKALKQRGYHIIATSPRGNRLQSQIELSSQPIALVVGNETSGISEEIINYSDLLIQIPMSNAMESLNVGVSTGISLYEIKLKQMIGTLEKLIKSTLGREINVTGMLIRKALDKQLSKVSNLTSKQVVFLMVLKCDTEMTAVEIQKQFGLLDYEKSNFFQPLLKKEFIAMTTSGNYIITKAGIETLGKLWTTIENTEKQILSDFTSEEQQTLKQLLSKIKTNCTLLIEND